MKLVSLSLRQWRTFERCDIEFPDGLIGIRGPNGAGKTTLAEAIGWALFGKIRPGGRIDDLRRQDAPKGESSAVELVFRIGPTLYRVERVVRGAAKLWIGDDATPETTQTRATNSRIALELDMTWDVFHRTVFARQKDVAALDPSGSADSRRRHVERLLGLERYRIAAEKARSDARSIADELTGRRADAPDVTALEADIATAEEQAAADDPHVERAAADAEKARKHFDALVSAVDREAERATKSVELEAERTRQNDAAEQAEREAGRLQTIIDDRATKTTRLEEIRHEASAAPEAARTRKLWDDLAEATTELETAEVALTAIGYDAPTDEETQSRFAALRGEYDSCQAQLTTVTSTKMSLERRLSALDAVTATGPTEAAESALDGARRDQMQTRERLGIERHQLEEDKTHVAAVAEGGGETPCPICLRPFGDEHEAILKKYRSRIDRREKEIAEIEQRDTELSARVPELERALRAAERSATALAQTEGPDDPNVARDELARAEATLAELMEQSAALEKALQALELATRTYAEEREKWRSQDAIRTDRAARAARILEQLGRNQYDADLHAVVNAEDDRLSALAAEVEQLSHDLVNTGDAEALKSDAVKCASDARAAGARATAELEALVYEPDRLLALREERDAAQSACDQATTALAEARAAAQTRSAAVRSLRERLDEARKVRDVIDERALELERHMVAADLLVQFRSYQSQRAWPHLEQGASAILSAATDGRYADVSLSDDFRIVILDGGERHELSRFSGGEQDVTNLCLRLAIAEWVAQERGAEINFVVLDEVFGSQDDERRQLLLGELRALGNRFQQLLVITHLADIADLCEHQIEVRLEELGRSTASVISG